jgi:hypothetical protein
MGKRNSKERLEEKRRKERIWRILDKNEKDEKDFLKMREGRKPKFDVSIKVHKNPDAKKQLAEKGIRIDLGGIFGAVFSKKNIAEGTGKVLKKADKMLKDGDKEYSEFGKKEKNKVKTEYGFRMKFLNDTEDTDKKEKSRGGKI